MGKEKKLHGHGCLQLQETRPVTTQGPCQRQARLEWMCLSRESSSALELFPRWTDIYIVNNDGNGELLKVGYFFEKVKFQLQHTNIIYEVLWIIRVMKRLTYGWGTSFCLTRISLDLEGRKTAMSKPQGLQGTATAEWNSAIKKGGSWRNLSHIPSSLNQQTKFT